MTNRNSLAGVAAGLLLPLAACRPDIQFEKKAGNLFRFLDHVEELEFTETPLSSLREGGNSPSFDSHTENTHLPPGIAELIDQNLNRDGTAENAISPFKLKITKVPRIDSVMGRRTMNVFLAPAPTTFSVSLRPSPGSTLSFGYGVILSDKVNRKGVFNFEIWVENLADRSMKRIFQKTLNPEFNKVHRRWLHRRVRLDKFANQDSRFLFKTSRSGPPNPLDALTAWVNPMIVESPEPHAKRPLNVVLISIDTLRADHLGCYGYPRDTSPNIDRLARQGVRFNWAISQAPYTLPSHMSLLTSLYPSFHKVYKMETHRLNPKLTTLAEMLYERGYQTWAITGGGQMSNVYGFSDGFETFVQYTSPSLDVENKVEEAIDFIDAAKDTSFFLFFHSYKTHAPYTPPPPFHTLFDPDYQGSITGSVETIEAIKNGELEIGPPDLNHIVSLYDGEIREVDSALGPLFHHLKRMGLESRTLIVFTSDHGEEFGEHGEVGRHSHTVYDELIRIPLIFKLPGVLPAGKVIDDQVQSIDILPTILELVGWNAPAGPLQGTSLAGLIRNGRWEALPEYAFSEKLFTDPIFIRTSRSAKYKYIFTDDRGTGESSHLYFELENDPGEQTSKPAAAEALRNERQRIGFLLEEGENTQDISTIPNIDEDTWEALKELGYVK